jgi:hypothetical protein
MLLQLNGLPLDLYNKASIHFTDTRFELLRAESYTQAQLSQVTKKERPHIVLWKCIAVAIPIVSLELEVWRRLFRSMIGLGT